MKKKTLLISIIGIIILFGGIVLFLYHMHTSLTERQAMIHESGTHVMPFDLNQTTHIFKKTNTGGVQQVIVKDNKNTDQISLIRMHSHMEAGMFQQGNFSDPTALHGENMPGVKELSQGAKNIKITYIDLPNGGQITYETTDKNLINSLHQWFDAQVSDHGNDAMGM